MDEQIHMQDSKDINLANQHADENEHDSAVEDQAKDQVVQNSSDSDGWQQYRKWISKAPAPRSRRTSIDPSLYTWKGYRNWSEQIRRNWSDS